MKTIRKDYEKSTKTILKDILTVQSGIIAHQVNMQGVMSSGLALQIKRKYPKVYSEYRSRIYEGIQLGEMTWVNVSDVMRSKYTLLVANLYAQDQYGSGLQTSYKHLKAALKRLNDLALVMNLPIHLPHGLGCSHGGDWAAVEKLIAEQCPEAIICKLPTHTEKKLMKAIESKDHATFGDLVGAMNAKDAAVFASQYTGEDFEYMLWCASRVWGFEVEWAGQYLLPEGDRDAAIELPSAQCLDWVTSLKDLPRWGY
jgi:O-acetyl-ADP-ribose deacetylase (regulator of RNase III)